MDFKEEGTNGEKGKDRQTGLQVHRQEEAAYTYLKIAGILARSD